MSSTTTAPAPKVAPRTLDHAKVIMVLGIVTILTLVPPLVLEVLLYQTASNVGQSTNADRVGTLLSTIQSESAGAMLLLRTVGTSTLTPFQRSAPFVQACATTDAAISDLSSHDEAADQLRQIEQRLSKLRDGVTRDGSLTALYVQAQYADVNVLASSLLLTLASQTNPEVSVRLSRATALSDAAGAWSRGVEPLHAAAESTSQSFQSSSAYQDFATAAKDAELALTHVRALQASSDTLQAVDTSRTVTTATTTTVASVTKTALDSAVSAAPTSTLTVPTAALTDGSAQRLATEFGTAMVTAANVEPTVSLELAQMLVTICACASVLAAIASIAYAISAGIASRHASGAHDAAITHMDNAYKRVVKLMDCMLHFDGEIPFQVVDGPALSPVEAELRALLKPMAKAISHVPRSALTRPMGAPSDDDPLAELDAEPSLRHNVTIMIIDLHFFDDMAVAGDAAKTLPGRANRLRGSVSSEVQRRGGVPVLAPVTRWAFAWNLTGHEKAGIQNATQCALSIIGANSVDYPTMRIVVLTGSVAVGSAGTSTFRTEILAGLPVLLIPLALRVARYHHSQLIVDADTHAHCSSQAYRARPVEVVGVDESSNGTVLYDMLSNLDSHDQRLLQWCEAFEKYHARRVKDALEAFRAWAKDGADRTVNRLIRQLEASPPRPITIGEAPTEVFSHIPSQQ